ncbi:MAG: hypothetical protein CSB49_00830 [Proteobacteria bacterium]|nr:MAG: hypothetical protein CSB49_00830 [Pseudomonadota bacterium]
MSAWRRRVAEGRGRRELYLRVLAHQHRDQCHRCLWLPLGPLRIALCSRCAGLYPTLVAGLAFQLTLGLLARPSWIDWPLVLLLSVPALLDWGASRLGRKGSNLVRVATGVLLGIALARSSYVYIHDPYSELLWIQIGLLAMGVFAFELVHWLDFSNY